jgi:hypothetical protein
MTESGQSATDRSDLKLFIRMLSRVVEELFDVVLHRRQRQSANPLVLGGNSETATLATVTLSSDSSMLLQGELRGTRAVPTGLV